MEIVPGESWLGLRELHRLTSGGKYSLRITLVDFDGKSYQAVYDQFEEVSELEASRFEFQDAVAWLNRVRAVAILPAAFSCPLISRLMCHLNRMSTV